MTVPYKHTPKYKPKQFNRCNYYVHVSQLEKILLSVNCNFTAKVLHMYCKYLTEKTNIWSYYV